LQKPLDRGAIAMAKPHDIVNKANVMPGEPAA